MGVGDSLEAAYTLKGPIAAGSWHLIGDGIVAGANVTQADVRFDVIWRRGDAPDSGGSDGGGGAGNPDDAVITSFSHHFLRNSPTGFSATTYSDNAMGIAAAASAGDRLVLRITATGGDTGLDFIPNGDGATENGAIPELDLPK